MQQRWPDQLWVVRHGESVGNLAHRRATMAGLPALALDLRDPDVPLSDLGREQSQALGRWFGALPSTQRPEVMLVSPYIRVRQTAELIARAAGLPIEPGGFVSDERLREKELGILDLLTETGIAAHHPEQARFRQMLGKFYHRPPGGESWCDVILRLRSLLDTVSLHYAGCRILVVTHQVVILCLRYLLEGLTEEQLLAIDRDGAVANCAVTEYAFDAGVEPPRFGHPGGMALRRYNFTAPMIDSGTRVTAEPPVGVAVGIAAGVDAQ
jgi:2,3-bisphosphoglycerate-dependent phosphoglycerate mutase